MDILQALSCNPDVENVVVSPGDGNCCDNISNVFVRTVDDFNCNLSRPRRALQAEGQKSLLQDRRYVSRKNQWNLF